MSQLVRRSWSSASDFENIGGYDRVLRVGDFAFVAGTTGFDYRSKEISDDLGDQVRQAMKNVREALLHVGADISDIVRLRWIVTDAENFAEVGRLLRIELGENRPPATTLVAGLVDSRMQFEIEATAILT